MAEFISKIPGNLTEYPNAFKRQGAFPLEAYSVFASVAEAETYAQTNPLAYVGQVIAVTYKTTETIEEQTVTTEHARLYVIRTEAGALLELGSTESINKDLDEVWAVLDAWAPFFEDKESLDKAYDTLKEIQAYIDEHGDDFSALFADVKNIYHAEYQVDEKGDYVLDENGKKIIVSETGLLIEEKNRAIAAEEAIYKATEVKDENGAVIRVDETGKLIEVKNEINDYIAALFSPNDGEGESGIPTGKIVDYIVDAVPVATLEKLGRVKSSNADNQVFVETDGTMTVNSLSTDKLFQGTMQLIMNGGDAELVVQE